VEMVLNNPSFKEVALNLKKSFQKSGGYKEAVDEIFIFVGQ
ncbi:glycosyl transferase family 1, partial [Bacillus cereus]